MDQPRCSRRRNPLPVFLNRWPAKGMDDPRGNLALCLRFLMKTPSGWSGRTCPASYPPGRMRWEVSWTKKMGESEAGSPTIFDTFTSGLAQLGYGVAWRGKPLENCPDGPATRPSAIRWRSRSCGGSDRVTGRGRYRSEIVVWRCDYIDTPLFTILYLVAARITNCAAQTRRNMTRGATWP